MISWNNVFVFAPHTDDVELGMGATLAKMLESGITVNYVAFSIAEESLPNDLDKNTLAVEVENSLSVLGISKKNQHIHRFRVRNFSYSRQDILDIMIDLRNRYSPDAIFIPSPNDVHQDHQVVSQEAIRAFKNSNIFAYELPWNNFEFKNQYFVRLEVKHLDLKIEALRQYKSQNCRSYMSPEFIKSQLLYRGVQSNTYLAECFEVIRVYS